MTGGEPVGPQPATVDDGERESPAATDGVLREFLARELIIDCHQDDCAGIYLTRTREILWPPGSGSRVVLRCTRRPEDHELTLTIRPYSEEESGVLTEVRERGEGLRCPRCETPLGVGSGEGPSVGGDEREDETSYRCRWCGVRWRPTERGEEAR